MRRGIAIAMVLLGLGTFVSGIVDSSAVSVGGPGHHIIFAVLFAIVVCIHGWLNRKPLIRYFKGLGWGWVLVGLGLAVIVVANIV